MLRNLLEKSARAATGGNLQPWKIFIVNKKTMKDFLAFQESWNDPEAPAYDIYPPSLKEPYRTYRYELGEQMYSLLGIPREDKSGRLTQVLRNFNFLMEHLWNVLND